MDDLERLLIERACGALVTRYCHLIDHGEAARVAELFTEDGVWASPENTMTGRAAILKGFTNRQNNRGRMSRHICNNLLIDVIDGDTASGVVYLTLYRHDGEEGRRTSVGLPAMVGEYRDRFRKTLDGWRFERREIVVSFAPRLNVEMVSLRINPERHQGSVFVITGGGSGIGAAAARRLAAEGAKVVVADLRGASADAVADEIGRAGGEAIGVQCDVSFESDVQGLTAQAIERFGRIEGLFANAGTAGRGWIHETALADWQRVLAVNLTGVFLSAKHVLPHLLKQGGGVIVTTGSIASVVIGGAGSAASYAASKGGVLQLTRQIAVDYGAQGIRAVCLCPGAVKTDMAAHVVEDRQGDETVPQTPLPRPKPWTPMQRAAEPEEIAAVVSFLMSPEASFITGSAVFADGGLTAI